MDPHYPHFTAYVDLIDRSMKRAYAIDITKTQIQKPSEVMSNPMILIFYRFLLVLIIVRAIDCNLLTDLFRLWKAPQTNDKGTPFVRKGRKATGLIIKTAELPKWISF